MSNAIFLKKILEWDEYNGRWYSRTPICSYTIIPKRNGEEWACSVDDACDTPIKGINTSSVDEAKSAAQNDYERRLFAYILSNADSAIDVSEVILLPPGFEGKRTNVPAWDYSEAAPLQWRAGCVADGMRRIHVVSQIKGVFYLSPIPINIGAYFHRARRLLFRHTGRVHR